MMKCLVCGSDDTEWVGNKMDNETEGYEIYSCKACWSRSSYGFEILQLVYTSQTEVDPFEEERSR